MKEASFVQMGSLRTKKTKIKFFLVGRNQNGQRWWVRGNGHLSAHQPERDRWTISAWELDSIESQVAERDPFSEISLPAGVAVSIPPYGFPGSSGFAYHGSAAGDLDSDGLIDLVTTGNNRSYVYRNLGDGKFDEIGAELGFSPMPSATAPLLLDYDGDGDLDIFFSAIGQQLFFVSQYKQTGQLKFLDYSAEAAVDRNAVGFSAAAGDVNGDGHPDIYVSSYNRYGQVLPNSWHQATNGTPNLLFVNQGDGSFKELASAYGLNDSRWSYAAQFSDVDGDGRQDLYVANDYGENALYINRGDKFEDRTAVSGVVDPGNGMGVSFGDYNNDGQLDLFVTNMSSTAGNRILNRLLPNSDPGNSVLRKLASGSSLFTGSGDGNFQDVTRQLGPFSTGWAWGGVFVDFNNDGWQDIYLNSGFISGKSMKDT